MSKVESGEIDPSLKAFSKIALSVGMNSAELTFFIDYLATH